MLYDKISYKIEKGRRSNMNKVIEQLQNRRSVRNFTGEKVKDEDLELILRTAQRAPSSVNGQQISLIVTRDKEKLKKIAEICGGQGILQIQMCL